MAENSADQKLSR